MAKRVKKGRGEQGLFAFKQHGGARKGAGCKKKSGAGITHNVREELPKGCPVHVTVRLEKGLPSLRQDKEYELIRECFRAGRERFGFRLVHYSVQGNHLHLIVEASDRRALTRGMQGLLIRIARGLNRLWKRKGGVFAHRYHARPLKTPREVRNAIAYVLHNVWKHMRAIKGTLDKYCSGWWFDGWREKTKLTGHEKIAMPVSKARTWLLTRGWRKHRLISIFEVPKH